MTSPLSNGYVVPLLLNVTNGPSGPVSYQYGNGLYGVNRFDGLSQRTGGWVCSGSSSLYCAGGVQRYGYTIIPNGGRVNQVCDTVLGGCGNMSYDSFNRLTARTAITGAPLNESWSYDRYGNRWGQAAAPSGSQAQFAFKPANNQVVGFQYDAAGNLLSDGMHNYSYDAEGNLTLVDGGAAAHYGYDAANQRVRTEAGGKAVEWVFNLAGQKVSAWDADTGAVLEQSTYWGAQSLSVFANNTLYFKHADWLGSKRLLSAPDGSQAGAYGALPFGDDLAVSGADLDPLHFAGLDHDYESGLDHAQYREYTSAQAHWMSPDPYSGSYDWANPQSLNRYSYVMNNPLSLTDPSGQDCTSEVDPNTNTIFCSVVGSSLSGGDGGLAGLFIDLGNLLIDLFGGDPSFHGSLKPRPVAQNSDPCAYLGTAKTPSQYAAAGKQFANTLPYDPAGANMLFKGFPMLYSDFHRGGSLDAQPYASGSGLQKASYGNYAYGIFFAAAGFSLNDTLSFASNYGYKQQIFNGAYQGRNLDPNNGGIPVENVQNITAGYNAQLNGTTCHQ